MKIIYFFNHLKKSQLNNCTIPTLMSLIIGLFIIRVLLCVATFENINVLVYNKCLGLVCLGNITK